LVVIAIIGILIGMIFPAVAAVRNAARSTQCKSNLRQFAVCLLAKSSNSPNGRYCSGAFDSDRDGAFDQYSWVSDCVDQDVLPGQLLCPQSICLGSEKWNPKSSDASSAGFVGGRSAPPGRRGVSLLGEPQDIAEAGFNTNYATSWHLVRGAPVFSNSKAIKAVGTNGLKNWYLNDSNSQAVTGPMTLRDVDTGDVPANTIALMGCGSKGDEVGGEGDGILETTVASNGEPVRLVTAGVTKQDLMVDNFPQQGDPGVSGVYLQDTRDWFAWHSKTVNIVFADGSVRALDDTNGDGYINPGFAVNRPTSATEIENQANTVGYLSPETETNPFEIFSGTLLRGSFGSKKFEQ